MYDGSIRKGSAVLDIKRQRATEGFGVAGCADVGAVKREDGVVAALRGKAAGEMFSVALAAR